MSKAVDMAAYAAVAANGFMFRNRIINGACAIDQRTAFAGPTTLPVNTWTYVGDRNLLAVNGAGTTANTLTSVNFSNNNPNGIQVNGGAGVTNPQYGQKIEAMNSRDLAGQVVSFQAMVYQTTGSNQTMGGNIYRAGSTDNFSAPVWDASITFQNAVVASGVPTIIKGTATLSSSATTGLFVTLSMATSLAAGQVCIIQNIQLEKGAIATPFEFRPYGTELALCQRYYWSSPITSVTQAIETISTISGAPISQPVAFIPPMRITNPTVSSPTVAASIGCNTSGVQLGWNGNPSVLICNGTFNVAVNNRCYVSFNTGNFTASAEL